MCIRDRTIGDVEKNSITRVLYKELRVAGTIALLLGVIAAIDTYLVNGIKSEPIAFEAATTIAVAIGAAMVGHVLSAALLGACTPIVVKQLRGDPAMISTPAVTAIADLTGAAIYLVTVTLMLAP